ncbi:MAG: hypothetical protein DI535_04305 [Citrobacter freundii]|nr:MAG: hypothetical protein DI535_04305 [Citrobacter freundii]
MVRIYDKVGSGCWMVDDRCWMLDGRWPMAGFGIEEFAVYLAAREECLGTNVVKLIVSDVR